MKKSEQTEQNPNPNLSFGENAVGFNSEDSDAVKSLKQSAASAIDALNNSDAEAHKDGIAIIVEQVNIAAKTIAKREVKAQPAEESTAGKTIMEKTNAQKAEEAAAAEKGKTK